jgi:hypothetical protein
MLLEKKFEVWRNSGAVLLIRLDQISLLPLQVPATSVDQPPFHICNLFTTTIPMRARQPGL